MVEMMHKWALLIVHALSWQHCVAGYESQIPTKEEAPSCVYYNSSNEIQCQYLEAGDMDLLTQTLRLTTEFVASFGLVIESSDGPSIPLDVFRGYNLTKLDLDSCNFSSIPYELLSSIESPLRALYIETNSFSSVEMQSTELFLPFSEYLSELQIFVTNIEKIDVAALTQFTTLNSLVLFYNNINAIGLELLGKDTLQYLYLGSNNVSSIETGAFRDLRNLQSLLLDNNNLSELQEGAFMGLEESPIVSITLGGNPWNCTCDLQWLKNWLDSRNLTESSEARCAYPSDSPFDDIEFC